MILDVGSATDTGSTRQRNEDAFRVFHGDARLSGTGRGSLFAVADGLGGHRGGAEAARMAVDQLFLFYQYPRERFQGYDTLVDLIRKANRAVWTGAQQRGALQRMGCTLSVLHVDFRVRQAFFAHVGDSRIYLLRGTELRQITEDHTDPEHTHVLSNHIGLDEQVRIDTNKWMLRPGDRILICSDGLPLGASHQEMTAELAAPVDAQRMADALIALAARQGLDNATAVVIAVNEAPAESPS